MKSIINSKLILIISLIAVIFLTSCTGSKEKKEILSTCEKITDARIKNTCLAIAEKNTVPCDKISDNRENADEKDFCYMAVALETKNIALCEKLSTIPTSDLQDKPYTSKFTCKALVENNSAGCHEAVQKEFYGLDCFIRLAEITKNPNLCDAIRVYIGEQASECNARVEKNVAHCTTQTDQPWCYAQVAILKGDSAICDSMPDAPYLPDMQKARDICKAVANRDVSGLDCTVEFKPVTTFAESTITYKACSAIAALTEDLSVCDKIVIKGEWVSPDPSPKDKCYLNVILQKSGILPIETLINSLGRIWQ